MTHHVTIVWPEVGGLGWVRMVDYAAELPIRFEDLEGDDIIITTPFDPRGQTIIPPKSGTEFFLGWSIDRAIIEVPVSLVGIDEANVSTWSLEAIGEPTETQRRNYVRVPTLFDISLDLYESGPPFKAVVIDLSEGGLRASVDRWAIDPGLRRFDLTLPLPEGGLTVVAQVVWWGNLDADGRRTIGLRFVDLEMAVADTIRRQVFGIQLEQRRRA